MCQAIATWTCVCLEHKATHIGSSSKVAIQFSWLWFVFVCVYVCVSQAFAVRWRSNRLSHASRQLEILIPSTSTIDTCFDLCLARFLGSSVMMRCKSLWGQMQPLSPLHWHASLSSSTVLLPGKEARYSLLHSRSKYAHAQLSAQLVHTVTYSLSWRMMILVNVDTSFPHLAWPAQQNRPRIEFVRIRAAMQASV